MSDFYGPALPPGFKPPTEAAASGSSHENPEHVHDIPAIRSVHKGYNIVAGPNLPPVKGPHARDTSEQGAHLYGPKLPPGLKASQDQSESCIKESVKRKKFDSHESSDSSSDSSTSEDEAEHACRTSRRVGPIGPTMPPGFKMDSYDCTSEPSPTHPHGQISSQSAECSSGPMLPPGVNIQNFEEDEEDDDAVYGPLPNAGGEQTYSAAEEFERRAQRMKRKLDGSDSKDNGPGQRDSWMMELPDKLSQAFSGTTARKFRANAAPEISDADRSLWTDTPADKERKEQEEREGKHKHKKKKRDYKVTSSRDKAMRKQVEDYNKSSKRTESLLDMHQKKLKKKKKEKKKKGEKEKNERRPFDRELDLRTNVIDDAKRKALIKKASGLGGNFHHGGVEFL